MAKAFDVAQKPPTHQKPPEHFYYLCVCIWERLGYKKFIDLTIYSLCILFWGFKESSYAHFHILCIFRLVGWVKIKRRRRRLRGLRRLSARPKTLFFFRLTFVYVHELLFKNIFGGALLVMKIDLTIKFVRRLRILKTWEIHHVTMKWPEGEL